MPFKAWPKGSINTKICHQECTPNNPLVASNLSKAIRVNPPRNQRACLLNKACTLRKACLLNKG